MKKVLNRLVLLVLTVFCVNAYSWGSIGHQVIAEIAYSQLQPNVKKKVDQLAVTFSQQYPDINSFVAMAPWADTLRDQGVDTYSAWHYIDNPYSPDGTPAPNPASTNNVVWAINQIEPTLSNPNTNVSEQARQLAFFIHFVGDAHQPLHTMVLYSAKFPQGDKGGNSYVIQYQLKHYIIKNLHSFWDDGLGVFDSSSSQTVTAIANQITTLYPANYFGDQVSDLKPEDWAAEGMKLAPFVYSTPEGVAPSASYISSGQQIAEQRAALAGYRLAAILNQVFANA